jgi:transcriptional regulator with XRE-family HTH domain
MVKSTYEYSEFGKHLRSQRKLKFDDMKAFSSANDIPSKDLYEYESGRTFPPIEKFVKICSCLDKSPTYLLSPILKLEHSEQEFLHLLKTQISKR